MQANGHSVTAVVVTFNRKDRLLECLDALANQSRRVESVIVVDNASGDGTPEALRRCAELPAAGVRHGPGTRFDGRFCASGTPVQVLRLDANRGGAGGFHFGMELGMQSRVEWLWLMDDDAVPQPDALRMLVGSRAARRHDTVALASAKIDRDGRIQAHHAGRFDVLRGQLPFRAADYGSGERCVDYASFVGLAVRRAAAARVGLPRADFFITHDDLEYSLRLQGRGKIRLVPASRIVHADAFAGRPSAPALAWGIPREDIGLYWRYLCDFRNRLYVMRTYGSLRLPGTLFRLLRRIGRILLLDPDRKWLRTRWTVAFFADLFRDEFRNVTPAQWQAIVAGRAAGPRAAEMRS